MTTYRCGLALIGLWCALASLPARADDAPPAPAAPAAPVDPAAPPALAKPAQAWADALKDMKDPAKNKPNLLESRSKEYLAGWDAAKPALLPEDAYALGMMLVQARRAEEALGAFRTAAACEALPKPQRLDAALAFAGNAAQAAQGGRLKGEGLAAAVKDVEGWGSLADGPAKGRFLNALGALHVAAGQKDKAFEEWVASAEINHPTALGMAGRIVEALLADVHDLDGAVAARAKAAPLLERLRSFQQQALEEARKARDEEKDDAMKPRRDQAFRGAEAGLKRFDEVDRPLKLYGSPAQDWTLVKAYGKGTQLADYAGKVVVLDFWATWCPWCIKSFPALRDLLRDYAGKDLVVVGVTTSATSVYDQRYDLDDDLKAKATGEAPKPTLLRPRLNLPQGAEPTAEQKAEQEKAMAEFRAKEIEIVATFLKNHAVPWDVVQIDEQEPTPKYALSGWPHCIVLDRQGRVRYLHSGALLRDRAEQIAEFRKVLDGLLAEPAATK